MAFRQKRYCVLNESLRLDIGWICDYVSVNGFALRQEVNAKTAIAVIHQVGRLNAIPMLDKDLRNMPTAATGFPYSFREAFELKQLFNRSGGVA